MFASGIISILLKLTPLGAYLFHSKTAVFDDYLEYPLVVLVTTIIWLIATYMTQPESPAVLQGFYKRIQPGGPGWTKIVNEAKAEHINLKDSDETWSVPSGILAMLLGCVLIYSCMFATGYWIYGDYSYAIALSFTALISGYFLKRTWKKIKAIIL